MFARFLSYLRLHHIGLIALFIALSGSSYAAVKTSVGRGGESGPSRYVQDTSTLPLTGTDQVVTDLASVNNSSADHQITTTATGRILATATVRATTTAGVGSRDSCQLEVSDGIGPSSGIKPMNHARENQDTPPIGNYDATVPLTGARVKPPGTYNVRVSCSGIGSINKTYANLNVWFEGKR
jgi:hypothetical protein